MGERNEILPIRVGIAGVRGYSGLETARLVARHPRLRMATASSDALAGHKLRQLLPDLHADGDAVIVGHNDTVVASKAYGVDVMFLALPAEQSSQVTGPLLDAGIRVVDLSGAHRLKDAVAHLKAYGFEPEDPARNTEAVYGLTEWAAPEALAQARLVANPGCYPTATLLALLPLVEAGLVEPGTLVVDAKSGTTGAGRSAKVSLLHAEIFANFYAYRVGQHQHAPEIAQQFSAISPRHQNLTFVTHLLPVARGILVTAYFRVPGGEGDIHAAAHKVQECLHARYEGAPFVKVLDRAEDVHLRQVVGTNRCVMSATADPFGRRVVVCSAIDNLIKGAAGQAVQNANVMFGLPQTLGLELGTGAQP
jgi:N-acetyl-gamma-glutamyl-phosphate reductase